MKGFQPEKLLSLQNGSRWYTRLKRQVVYMAEIEFSALSKQCLDRRIAERDVLSREVCTWVEKRNQQKHFSQCTTCYYTLNFIDFGLDKGSISWIIYYILVNKKGRMMKVKIFNGSSGSIEQQINDFLNQTNATVKTATQSLNMESPVDPILTITIFYE